MISKQKFVSANSDFSTLMFYKTYFYNYIHLPAVVVKSSVIISLCCEYISCVRIPTVYRVDGLRFPRVTRLVVGVLLATSLLSRYMTMCVVELNWWFGAGNLHVTVAEDDDGMTLILETGAGVWAKNKPKNSKRLDNCGNIKPWMQYYANKNCSNLTHYIIFKMHSMSLLYIIQSVIIQFISNLRNFTIFRCKTSFLLLQILAKLRFLKNERILA